MAKTLVPKRLSVLVKSDEYQHIASNVEPIWFGYAKCVAFHVSSITGSVHLRWWK